MSDVQTSGSYRTFLVLPDGSTYAMADIPRFGYPGYWDHPVIKAWLEGMERLVLDAIFDCEVVTS